MKLCDCCREKKGLEPISYCLSCRPGWDQLTAKLSPHTRTQSTVPLHLEHLHHLRASDVMETVSMTTTEKLNDGDETAERGEEELRTKV